MIGPLLVFWPVDHLGKESEYGVGQYYFFHNSEPRTKNLNLKGVNVTLLEPIDNRMRNFSDKNLMEKIQNKMSTDMTYFGASSGATDRNLAIKPIVNEYSPSGKGIFWKQSIARVSLDMMATLNNSTIISKKYQVKYATGGLDKDFEGNLVSMDDTEPSTVAMGVSLRKTLDQFYADLARSMAKAEVTKMNNVLFMVGTTDFESGAEIKLLAVADAMKHNSKMIIELDGYTDNQGDLLKDKELSRERTKTVKSYLVHHGVKARRIKTKAFGATRPVSTNHSEESRRLNRRVEFVVIKS